MESSSEQGSLFCSQSPALCHRHCRICLPVCQHSGTMCVTQTLMSCPPRDGEMRRAQGDSLSEWTEGRAGGRHREQVHSSAQNVRDCSNTAAAHTAPLPSTKKRKWLLQEEKKYPLTTENKGAGGKAVHKLEEKKRSSETRLLAFEPHSP